MAFSPPTTHADGDTLEAADVQGNLDAIRLYLSQVPSSAVLASPWVDTKHVVRGEYDPVTNQARMASGIYGGISVLNGADFTYGTVYDTLRLGTTVWEVMPGTGMTLEVRRPVSVMINWWMSAMSSDNFSAGAPGETQIRLYIGNKSLRYGEPVMLTEEDSTMNERRKAYRQVPGGFYVQDFTVGTYKLGLCAQSTTSKAFGFAWGVTAEAFAL